MADAQRAWSDGQFTPSGMPLVEVGAISIAAVEKVKTIRAIAEMDYDEYVTAMEDRE